MDINFLINKINIFKNWRAGLNRIKKIPWIFGRHVFLVLMLFVLIELITGEFLIYKYIILPQESSPGSKSNPLKFEDSTYQSVLFQWQERGKKFNGQAAEKRSSPF